MLKNILNLNSAKVLNKNQQKEIVGNGILTPCPFAPPCDPGMIEYLCECYHPWEL
ncbi:hypothetical protein [uncultured Aquimarina sp.]|uniref:hypothetical protein n=1 Tax=uncultured Aquimarina sp. TaxID=575652 RepID=UPI0026256D20|nr:hypothetical protein [uncultured Aquimarina sp.]